MIISMPTIARSQQRYDNRLRNLVQRSGDVTVATDLGVPRSTARGWLGKTQTVVVCLDVWSTASRLGLHGPEVLELHDRSVVALPETSMAVPALAQQRYHGASTGGVLRRPTQSRASTFGVSRADA